MVDHSEVVKNLHQTLRKQVKIGKNPDEVWQKLLQNKDMLKNYAKSMNCLAKEDWELNCSENRILWCQNVCKAFFFDAGLQKLVRKLEKGKLFQKLRDGGIEETGAERQRISEFIQNFEVVWNPILKDQLLLLDVGSCFNPFQTFSEFIAIPIDISPAIEGVLCCDFINVSFEKKSSLLEKTLSRERNAVTDEIKSLLGLGFLYAGLFDIVVFSLLLSYFPSASQRLQCCINAHKSLQLYGLLLIITPDSSHQNRHAKMMSSWKHALECIGFTRYKYEKLKHLHCMAYMKSSELLLPFKFDDISDSIYIPQDFQELEITKVTMETSGFVEDMNNTNFVSAFAEMDL